MKAKAVDSLWDGMVFDFRYSVSRAPDTYGYNICSLWVNGAKVSSCNGGGYDMKGVAFADWVEAQFPEQVKALPKYDSEKRTGYYAVTRSGGLDGACGFSCVEDVLASIGYRLRYVPTRRKNDNLYTLEKIEPVTDPNQRWR